MLSNKSKLWVEAAKQLTINPQLLLKCPECKIGNLQIKDEPIELWNKIDRFLICDNCGKYNVITMTKQ